MTGLVFRAGNPRYRHQQNGHPDTAGGGLLLITRADLLDRVGDPIDERRLAEQVALLDTDIRLLGA